MPNPKLQFDSLQVGGRWLSQATVVIELLIRMIGAVIYCQMSQPGTNVWPDINVLFLLNPTEVVQTPFTLYNLQSLTRIGSLQSNTFNQNDLIYVTQCQCGEYVSSFLFDKTELEDYNGSKDPQQMDLEFGRNFVLDILSDKSQKSKNIYAIQQQNTKKIKAAHTRHPTYPR